MGGNCGGCPIGIDDNDDEGEEVDGFEKAECGGFLVLSFGRILSTPGNFCIILLIDMLIKGTFVLSFCDAMVDVVEETLLESGD